MRIWIDPARLVGYKLSAADVNAAIRKAVRAESYAVGDQSVNRNVRVLREHRAYLEREIAALDADAAGATQGGVAIASWDA